MAILDTETLVRKRAGNVVFYPRLGVQVVRSLPSKYRDAKTEQQLFNRAKLKILAEFLAPLNNYLRNINFRNDAFNYIEGLNFNCAVVGKYPDLYVDLEKIVLSDGVLDPVEDLEAEVLDGKCLLTWNYGGSVEDRMVCVCCVDSITHAFSTFFEICPVGQYSLTLNDFKYEEAVVYFTVISGGNSSISALCKITK